jgi:hypothetical protein
MNLYFFVGLVLLEASGMIVAVRIPLDYNSPTPFLHHSGADGNSFNRDFLSTFSWSSNFLGKLLHQASKVEIGPRGVRFIRQHGSQAGQSFEWIERSMGCTPSDLALCQVRTKEGWFLPSEGKWPLPPSFPITSNTSLIEDAAMRLFAGETACHGENQGPGRFYYHRQSLLDSAWDMSSVFSYSVTSCDVLHGRLLVVYTKGDETIFVYNQTFGPVAYIFILLSATISVGAIGYLNKESATDHQNGIAVLIESQTETEKDHGGTPLFLSSSFYQRYSPAVFTLNVIASLIVCSAIYIRNKFHFHIFEDSIVFWVALASGLTYSILSVLVWNYCHDDGQLEGSHRVRKSLQIDACMYSLQTIATAIYRTPENPYAALIVFFMACRIWGKFFMSCHGLRTSPCNTEEWYYAYFNLFDLILALVNFNILCEIGLKEQYILGDVWAYYFTVILFLSYSLIKYQWMMTIVVF